MVGGKGSKGDVRSGFFFWLDGARSTLNLLFAVAVSVQYVQYVQYVQWMQRGRWHEHGEATRYRRC